MVAKQAKDLAEELDLEEVVEEVNEVLQEPWAEDIEEYGYGTSPLILNKTSQVSHNCSTQP